MCTFWWTINHCRIVFLWVCWFLGKNLAFWDPPSLKFHNWTDLWRIVVQVIYKNIGHAKRLSARGQYKTFSIVNIFVIILLFWTWTWLAASVSAMNVLADFWLDMAVICFFSRQIFIWRKIFVQTIMTGISIGRILLRIKGQLVSECIFDVLNFPNNQHKNLTNFCPRI